MFSNTGDESIPLGTVIVAHTVNVFFKVALFNKAGKGVLFKVGDRTGIKLIVESRK